MRSATIVWPGSASCSSRAAALTAAPVTIASPGGGSSVATASPVLIPVRISMVIPYVSLEARVQVDEPSANRERRTKRARGVVLVRVRDAEHGHHGVADVLLDGPALRLDLAAHGGEPLAHHVAQLLDVEAVGKLRRAGHVREEDGHDLPLACRGRHLMIVRESINHGHRAGAAVGRSATRSTRDSSRATARRSTRNISPDATMWDSAHEPLLRGKAAARCGPRRAAARRPEPIEPRGESTP